MKEIDIILKNIKNKELLPVYFLHGDESFYIDLAVKHFEHDVLEEDEKAFNQTVAYGRDTNYLETLHQYLLCNGSIQHVASNMFCHRNTITYRMRVIEDHWDLKLDDTVERFHLMTAFFIRDYLNL